ncbi:MAG: hypothetical protein JWQ70_139 [Aeromicrobium sp.]|nr:hypothetical protein [Aeromicrobium sp.]
MLAATVATGANQAAAADPTTTVTFTSPGEHAYTVPTGVTRVDVTAIGGEGGGDPAGNAQQPGRGASVIGTLDVTPGQILYAVVGTSASRGNPGQNGGGEAGGAGAVCAEVPGAGGGATDIRTIPLDQPGTDESRVLVAGGGGGAGSQGASAAAPEYAEGYGGPRGQGGGSSSLGGDGAGGGVGAQGAAGSESDGTSTTGGRGEVGTEGSGSGCGGGGGGGYGGGGAGAVAPSSETGGGGGGGGSLVPGGFPAGMAARGESTSVTFSTPGLPVQTGPLAVTSSATLKQNNQGDGPVPFGNCPTSCVWVDGPATNAGPGRRGGDFGYASTQRWGAGGLLYGTFNQAFVSIKPGPTAAPADLGQPFLLMNFAHYNNPIRQDWPTALGLQTLLTVQPPAGSPVVFHLRGDHTIPLDFDETDNQPPCDPDIQQSSTPCDDSWSLPAYTATTAASGVTWHFELLGWRTPEGAFDRRISTEEDRVTQRDIYAKVTVDTNPTTSVLTVDDTTPASPVLTMTTTPVPQTGGTVTFTDGGDPIAGCVKVSEDTTTGVTTCTPANLSLGDHSFAGSFSGGIGYGPSDATAVPYTYLQSQTVTFDAPSPTYGDADKALGATASSGLPVTYTSSTTDVCTTTAAGALHIVAAGSCTVKASQAGDSTHSPAEKSQTFTIAKATLTVTADDKVRVQGTANPPLTSTTTGFVNGDPSSVVTGSPTLATAATVDSDPGGYTITASVDGLSAANYDFVGVDGTLEVTAALPAKHLDMDESTTKAMIGKIITVTVKDLAKGEKYTIFIGDVRVATGHADSKGKVKTSVQVPTSLPAGKTTIKVIGSQPLRNDPDSFTITHPGKIDIDLNHSKVKRGKTQKVKVKGLHPNEEATIKVDGVTVLDHLADNSGEDSFSFSVGNVTGTHSITVIGGYDGRSTTKTYKVK